MTSIDDRIVDMQFGVLPYEDASDTSNVKTHIVSPPENPHLFSADMEAQDIVNLARDLGLEVTALCGYKWVPKHDPDKHEACEACMKIAGDIMRALGE